MKKLASIVCALMFSAGAFADTYLTGQILNGVQGAANSSLVTVHAGDITQTAVNLANDATIIDRDGFGGDTYRTFQAQNGAQLAANANRARRAAEVEQVAANVSNTLNIKDNGGTPFFAAQSVGTLQLGNGLQAARNINLSGITQDITQTAVNLSNDATINLPSSPSISFVATGQVRNGAQLASNLNVSGHVHGALSQTAANVANTLSVDQ